MDPSSPALDLVQAVSGPSVDPQMDPPLDPSVNPPTDSTTDDDDDVPLSTLYSSPIGNVITASHAEAVAKMPRSPDFDS